MALAEVLPAAQALDDRDKIELIRILMGEVAHRRIEGCVTAGVEFPIWSAYESYGAAAILQDELGKDRPIP